MTKHIFIPYRVVNSNRASDFVFDAHFFFFFEGGKDNDVVIMLDYGGLSLSVKNVVRTNRAEIQSRRRQLVS